MSTGSSDPFSDLKEQVVPHGKTLLEAGTRLDGMPAAKNDGGGSGLSVRNTKTSDKDTSAIR